ANGIDVITDFRPKEDADQLDLEVASSPESAFGKAPNEFTAGKNFFLAGKWNDATSTFTVAPADRPGKDMLIIQGYEGDGQHIAQNESIVLLLGVSVSDLQHDTFI